MINKVTYTNGQLADSRRLKLLLVPKWLEVKLANAGFNIDDAGNTEKLSSILSVDDFRFYTDNLYGALATLFGSEVPASFLVSGHTTDQSIGDDLRTLLYGPKLVYGYDDISDPFAVPFKVTMLADAVVIHQADTTEEQQNVVEELMKYLTATVGLRVTSTLPIFDLFVKR